MEVVLQSGAVIAADIATTPTVEAALSVGASVEVVIPSPVPADAEVVLESGEIVAVNITKGEAVEATLAQAPALAMDVPRPARGLPARQDVSLCSLGGLGYQPGEVLVVLNVAGAASFYEPFCLASLEQAPTADCTFTVTRNGEPFAELFFAAGETDGAVTLLETSVAFRDKLRLLAPIPADATALGPSVTFASA